MVEALRAIAIHFSALGFESLRYKAVPYIYHETPSGDDLYALFRLSATRERCDLQPRLISPSRLFQASVAVEGLQPR